MLYVFLGIQGSGKGTQAMLLCQKLEYKHINLGELFREHITSQTAIGTEAQSYIKQGLLVPDSVVFKVIEDALTQDVSGFVFDGFPRTIKQAEFLTEKHKADGVIYLDLPDDIATERMLARRSCSSCRADYNLLNKPPQIDGICDKCGGSLVQRADDTPELIATRLQLFHNETKPLRDYYEGLGVLKIVDARGDIEQIHKEIVVAVSSLK